MNNRSPVSATQGKWFGKFSVELLDDITSKLDSAVTAVVGRSDSSSNSSSSRSRSRRTLSFKTDVQSFRTDQAGLLRHGETARRTASRRSVDVSSPFLPTRHNDPASPTTGDDGCVAQLSGAAPSGRLVDAKPHLRSRLSFDIGMGYRGGGNAEDATLPSSLEEGKRKDGNGPRVDDSDVAVAATSNREKNPHDMRRAAGGSDSGQGVGMNIPSYESGSTSGKDGVVIDPLTVVPLSASNRDKFQPQSSGRDGSSESANKSDNPVGERGTASLTSASRRKSESSCRLKMPMTTTISRDRRLSEASVSRAIPPCPPPSPDWMLNYRQSIRDDFWSAPHDGGRTNRETAGAKVGGAAELDVNQLTTLCEDWYRSGHDQSSDDVEADDHDADNEDLSNDVTGGADDVVRGECRAISPICNPNFEDDDETTASVEEFGERIHVLSYDRNSGRHRLADNGFHADLSELGDVAYVDRNVLMKTVQWKFDECSTAKQMSATAVAEAGRSTLADDVIAGISTREASVGRMEAVSSGQFYPTTSEGLTRIPESPLATGSITAQTQYLLVIPSVSLTRPDGENGSVASSPMYDVDVSAAVKSIVTGVQPTHTIRDNEDEDDDDDDNSGSTEGCDGDWEVWNNPDDFFDEELDLDPLPVGSLSRRSLHEHVSGSLTLTSSSSVAAIMTSQHGSGSSTLDRGRESMVFMADFVQKIFDPLSEISAGEKTRFNELCQASAGRLWFVRSLDSQQLQCTRQVSETTFYRLIQFCTLALFECEQADDHVLARAVMNLSFAFSFDGRPPQQQLAMNWRMPWSTADGAEVLYGYMRNHTAWNSLRFWTAAYFDAVQQERSLAVETTHVNREKLENLRQVNDVTNSAEYLGMFAMNMRTLGLSKSLCLEFVRKQSLVTNLTNEQIELLKDNIEKSPDVAT